MVYCQDINPHHGTNTNVSFLTLQVSDRTMLYQNKLTEARERKANLMDDSEASRIDAEIANYTSLLSQEEEKVKNHV